MHTDIAKYTRSEIKHMLRLCTDPQVLRFKRMYHHWDTSVDIDTAVDAIPEDKLDWAYTQISNTLKKFG